jgi:Flp pilus assembly protein TadD
VNGLTGRAAALAALILAAPAPAPAAAAQIKLDASLKELEARAARDSNDAAAHYNLGLAYWNAKRHDDAERAFRAAIALDARFPAPYIALAYLPHARRGRLWDEIAERRVPEEWQAVVEDAERMFRRAYVLDPFVELRLGDVVMPRATAYLRDIEVVFGEHVRDYSDALDQFFLGNNQKAYERFQRVINAFDGDRHPDRLSPALLWYHGIAAGRLARWPDAIRDFGFLLERSQKWERRDSLLHVPLRTNEYRYILALLHQRAGAPNDAIRLYREVIEHDLGLFMAHVRLAEIYEAAEMWDHAIVERRQAWDANPDDPSLLLDLGQTQARAGRFADAAATLQQASAAAPRDARPSYFLGVVLEQLGRSADARDAYERFLTLAPSRYARQIDIAKTKLAALR